MTDDIAEMVKGIFAPSQPPAPQPGWVATVTLEMVTRGVDYHSVRFPNGFCAAIHGRELSNWDWQPPPPPPWEPEVGKEAMLANEYGPVGPVTVLCLDGPNAWVKFPNNHNRTAFVCDLSLPKGGA